MLSGEFSVALSQRLPDRQLKKPGFKRFEMDLGLDGKRALITGSSSGIGAAIARKLAAEGCQIIVHGRDKARAEEVGNEVGAVAIAIGDLSTDEAADRVREIAGDIDILVNNAGGSAASASMPWLDVDEVRWADTYQMNVISAVRMIRRFLPTMLAQGWGRIINVASAGGMQPTLTGPNYVAAKGAMLNITSSLAKSLGDSGVTVNSVSPGLTFTPSVASWMERLRQQDGWRGLTDKEMEKRMATELMAIPIGRFGQPEDIAHAVCMVSSVHAGFMLGSNVRVDGGFVLGV